MAIYNSTEITRVYGDVGSTAGGGTITASTERTGDYAFNVGIKGLQVASFNVTRPGNTTGGDTYNLTVLPEGAVIIGAAFQSDTAWGGSGSSTLTFRLDGTDIATAAAIGTSGKTFFQSGDGRKVGDANAANGLVELDESSHAKTASVTGSGQIFYYVA